VAGDRRRRAAGVIGFMRKTKIVCTLGPASANLRIVRRMVRAGMDAARLNFSHGTHAEHSELLKKVRRAARDAGRPVAVIQDLSGPKLRIGEIAGDSVELKPGQRFVLTARQVPGNGQVVSVNHPSLPRELQSGDVVLLADGMIELKVQKIEDEDVICRVVIGGRLSSRKGINVPQRRLSIKAFTEKDRADLLWGIRNGVDLVAVSYVRCAEDLNEVRAFLDRHGARIPLIAKIEKHEALADLDDVIRAADAVMVARGDLGVDVPLEEVPGIQKRIIRRAAQMGRPVITATQMLRSMVDNPRPTRAEVTDVANAVLDGADATMLSEETAAGRYPVRAVEVMSRIITAVEGDFAHRHWRESLEGAHASVSSAVAYAACELAERVGAAAIVACTCSGRTAINVSRLRPTLPIFGATPNLPVYQRLALARGVVPVLIPHAESDDALIRAVDHYLVEQGLVSPGERVVLAAGVPVRIPGNTNFLRVLTAGTV